MYLRNLDRDNAQVFLVASFLMLSFHFCVPVRKKTTLLRLQADAHRGVTDPSDLPQQMQPACHQEVIRGPTRDIWQGIFLATCSFDNALLF